MNKFDIYSDFMNFNNTKQANVSKANDNNSLNSNYSQTKSNYNSVSNKNRFSKPTNKRIYYGAYRHHSKKNRSLSKKLSTYIIFIY